MAYCNPHETASVDEFYERLENGAEPDLVLLDLNLPGASGLTYCLN
jgi:CheY-like chemotaxis protein